MPNDSLSYPPFYIGAVILPSGIADVPPLPVRNTDDRYIDK
jgi:hypothetical protein